MYLLLPPRDLLAGSLANWDAPPLHLSISLFLLGSLWSDHQFSNLEEKHGNSEYSILSRLYFSEYEVQFLASISAPQVQRWSLSRFDMLPGKWKSHTHTPGKPTVCL